MQKLILGLFDVFKTYLVRELKARHKVRCNDSIDGVEKHFKEK